MANKQNGVDENILSTPLSKSAQTAILDRVNNSNELLQKKQFGLTPEEIDLHNRQIKALNTVESRVNAIFRSHTGSGNKNSQNTSSETIDSMLSIANTEYGAKGRSKSLDKRTKEAIEKAQKEILDLNKTFLNNMLETNKKNFQENLTTYNLIMKIIPKMRMVMKTFVNTIISPDDFDNATITTTVNGEIRQQAKLQQMMFKPDAIIEFVSQYITLQEGDIIFTGTPSGVVLGKNEKRYGWLKSGDTVSISISGIGTLVNQFK